MKTMLNELRISTRINDTCKRLYSELIKEGYSVEFYKEDSDYYLEINVRKPAMAYVVFDRTNNTAEFCLNTDTDDYKKEGVVFKATLETDDCYNQLLGYIKEHIKL